MEKLLKPQVYKDPLYGFVHVEYKIIKELIDSTPFQRLRRIKQLSGVFMVFHGAEHSRFSHSLGVYEVANRFLSIPDIKNEFSLREQLLFLATALLHDIGHGAYSHAFEGVFNVNHEIIGSKIIQEHQEIKKILSQIDDQFGNDIASILLKEKKYPLIEALISSQLDVDRLDYLERDAYYTGVSYGKIDLDRLMRVLYIRDSKIVFKETGIHAIENYLISRYHMYWQVYYHPVSRAYEVNLEKIYLRIKDLLEEGYEFGCNIIPLRKIMDDPNDINNFLMIDDYYINGLILSLRDSQDNVLNTLVNDFLNRKIWKYINDTKETQEKIDSIIKGYNKVEQKYYQARREVANSAYHDEGHKYGEKINILLENGKIVNIKDQSLLVESLIKTGMKADPKFFYRIKK